MQQPGPSAGRLLAGPVCLAPDGVWLAAVSPRRWWALTPPFHPYLQRLRRIAAGGLLSVPLSVGFRRLGRPSVLPCGVRTFLGSRKTRGHPACTRNCSFACSGRVENPLVDQRRRMRRRSRRILKVGVASAALKPAVTRPACRIVAAPLPLRAPRAGSNCTAGR